MDKNYSYPLNDAWNQTELVTVIKMFELVEAAYETGVNREDILNQYQAFKDIVSSKLEEKQLGKQFKARSGYELYQVIKTAQTDGHKMIKMTVR